MHSFCKVRISSVSYLALNIPNTGNVLVPSSTIYGRQCPCRPVQTAELRLYKCVVLAAGSSLGLFAGVEDEKGNGMV